MPSTFMGLEIARRGLSAARLGMEISGHNVANANTPGYSRQRPVLATTDPYTLPSLCRPQEPLMLGTGVEAKKVERVRDSFLDIQVRAEVSGHGTWEVQRDALGEIETVFMEPSESGLSSLFSKFWSSWQELSKNAENTPTRAVLVQNAESLAVAIRHTQSLLDTVRDDQRQLANIYINDINSKARQIAALNVQIANSRAAGDEPNDLLDKRDLLLDELAALAAITVTEDGLGAVKVTAGSAVLVDGKESFDVPQITDWTTDPFVNSPYDQFTAGRLYGVRQNLAKVASYAAGLDTLASALISEVNTLHRAGYGLDGTTGTAFFTGSGASDIGVNPDLAADLGKVAAASVEGAPGDGSNALKIARLETAVIEDLGNSTIAGYYQNLVSRLGVEAQEAARMTDNQKALVDQLTARRDSISGVSLDEEMTNLVQYQYAYMACARVITTLDSLLDTLINRTAV